jgi:integrase
MSKRIGHVRERSPGAWEIRYSLGTNPATGKRRMVTATVRGSRKDAERELRRLLRTLDTNEHVDPSRITLGQWLPLWHASIKSKVSPKTHERYGDLVNGFLIPELGGLLMQKLAPTDIAAVYTKWQTEGRRDGKPGPLAPSTRRYLHAILHSSLKRAVKQQVIPRNPADALQDELPKVERRELDTLTPEQSARLLAALEKSYVYWPAFIALATGMRRGEILALRWKNVDLDRGFVRVLESLEETETGLRFKSPKTNKARSIALPAFAVDKLRTLKVDQAKGLLAIGIRQTVDALVCGRPDGEPYRPHSISFGFTRAVKKLADFPPVSFHDLRHSHATQLLLAGVHPKVAQERLGHSTIATTMDLYSHVTETMQEDAASRIDAAFQSAMKSR